MIRLLFIVSFMWVTNPVFANDKPTICRIIDKHVSQNDVAYQAGVDVYGRAVVPADLNSNALQIPNVIKVPLNIDLAQRMGSMIEGLDLDAPLGMIEIHQDGRVLYDERDLGAPMAALCGQSHKVVTEEKNTIKTPVQEPEKSLDNGLEPQDNIKSIPEVSKRVPETMIEIVPTVPIPPTDVNIEQIEVKPPVIELPQSDVIEGGEYREIYYNE